MNLLFLSYWGAREGLSSATVIPHLRILSSFPDVSKIIFCSIERDPDTAQAMQLGDKIQHIPLLSDSRGSILATKARDFYTFPKALIALCKKHAIDLIICRSSLGGALGHLVHRKNKIPYVVESFEPHADYMLEARVWSRHDPRLWIQRYFEKQIKRTARALLPVAYHYRDKLVSEGVDVNNIIVQPCCVDLNDFSFSETDRDRIRSLHGIPTSAKVGIYVGKFGGIYYEQESFELYAHAFRYFGDDFYLIIISADPHEMIQNFIRQHRLPSERVLVLTVSHRDVPHYLSAADFAISIRKPAASRIYCSPIKDGEYWANGLPIVIEDRIGDDSVIVQREGGGVILDWANPQAAFSALAQIMKPGRSALASAVRAIAFKHRRIELIRESYAALFDKIFQKF